MAILIGALVYQILVFLFSLAAQEATSRDSLLYQKFIQKGDGEMYGMICIHSAD